MGWFVVLQGGASYNALMWPYLFLILKWSHSGRLLGVLELAFYLGRLRRGPLLEAEGPAGLWPGSLGVGLQVSCSLGAGKSEVHVLSLPFSILSACAYT